MLRWVVAARAVIYARISRDREGAGLGAERQEQDCRELATRLGWTVVHVFVDNDLSAYSGKPRPGYKQLLDWLRNGQADAVLAWHTDRLHRSPVELEEYIAICDPGNIPTATVRAGPLDLTTPSGKVVARTLGAFARYEVEHMIERQQRAKLQAASEGRWRGGRRPFGFEADGVTIIPAEAQEIARMAELVLLGASLRSLALDLNARDIPTSTGGRWAQDTVRKVLLRPRNAGLIDYRGDILGPAQWPAIIPPDRWKAVKELLANPGRRNNPGSGRRWLGSGLFLCGICGKPVKVHTTSTTARRVEYLKAQYICRSKEVARNVEQVDDVVVAVVLERCSRPDALARLDTRPKVDTTMLVAQQAGLRQRLASLTDLFTEGAIDAVQLRDGSAKLREQLAALEQQMAAVSQTSALAGIAGAPDPASIWAGMDLARRRAVVDALMTVRLLPAPKGRPVGWRPGQPYFHRDSVDIAPRVPLSS